MSSYTTHKTPHVTYFPTLTGGVGAQELERFYREYFSPAPTNNSSSSSSEQTTPASPVRLTLISRTIGADRVVDELHVRFKHTQPMPWILPGVPPTNKRVEVLVVSIVTVRGGRLYSEHVYWDQASVLVQIGLLDPKLSVPERARQKYHGAELRLPVVGREAARRVLGGMEDAEDGEADNELLPGWYDDEDEDQDDGGANAAEGGKEEGEEEGLEERTGGTKQEDKSENKVGESDQQGTAKDAES